VKTTGGDRPKQTKSNEFLVRIEGIKLPADAADRIARAVRKAALTELAGLNLKVGLGVRFVGNGGTQGIEIIPKKQVGPS